MVVARPLDNPPLPISSLLSSPKQGEKQLLLQGGVGALGDQTAVDYFILRLSELEFRVRQTENYINLTDELKEVKFQKLEQKNQIKQKTLNAIQEQITMLDRANGDTKDRLKEVEANMKKFETDIKEVRS